MYAWQFAKALYLADLHHWTRFVSMQNHYNLLYREEEREMMALCRSEGIGVIPWSPLARGRLTRPWKSETTKRSQTDQFGNGMYSRTEASDRKVVDRLGQIAEHRGLPTRRSRWPGCSASRSSPRPSSGPPSRNISWMPLPLFPCASLQMTSPPWRNSTSRIRFSASAEAAATSDTGALLPWIAGVPLSAIASGRRWRFAARSAMLSARTSRCERLS